jgi:hypothetical protein
VITPPRRSVTRFFIPMIDVLILLVCIFLLMPFVSKPEEATPQAAQSDPTPKSVAELEAQLAAAKRKVAELVKDRPNAADQYLVKVLEIDKATGRLYHFDPDANPPRQEVKDQADAQRLIDRQRAAAAGKHKDVFLLILYPRELSGYPLEKQVDAYRRWFKDVPHGFDNPWAPGSG